MFWLSVSHGSVERIGTLDSSGFVLRCCLGQLYLASRATNVRPNRPVEMARATSLYELLIIRPMDFKGTTGVGNHLTKHAVSQPPVCSSLSLLPLTTCRRSSSSIASAHTSSPRPTYCPSPTTMNFASALADIDSARLYRPHKNFTTEHVFCLFVIFCTGLRFVIPVCSINETKISISFSPPLLLLFFLLLYSFSSSPPPSPPFLLSSSFSSVPSLHLLRLFSSSSFSTLAFLFLLFASASIYPLFLFLILLFFSYLSSLLLLFSLPPLFLLFLIIISFYFSSPNSLPSPLLFLLLCLSSLSLPLPHSPLLLIILLLVSSFFFSHFPFFLLFLISSSYSFPSFSSFSSSPPPLPLLTLSCSSSFSSFSSFSFSPHTKHAMSQPPVCPSLSLLPSTSCRRSSSNIASAQISSPRPTYCPSPTIMNFASALADIDSARLYHPRKNFTTD